MEWSESSTLSWCFDLRFNCVFRFFCLREVCSWVWVCCQCMNVCSTHSLSFTPTGTTIASSLWRRTSPWGHQMRNQCGRTTHKTAKVAIMCFKFGLVFGCNRVDLSLYSKVEKFATSESLSLKFSSSTNMWPSISVIFISVTDWFEKEFSSRLIICNMELVLQ